MDIITPLEHIRKKNDEMHNITIFHGAWPPDISIRKYISILFHYICDDEIEIFCAIYYLWKYIKIMNIKINIYNVHRLFLTSLIISHKYHNDMSYNNKYISKIAGVKLKNLNKMELKFIKNINWELDIPNVNHNTFKIISEDICNINYNKLLKYEQFSYHKKIIKKIKKINKHKNKHKIKHKNKDKNKHKIIYLNSYRIINKISTHS